MPIAVDKTSKFLNSREWRTFLSAAQATPAYPRVMSAVRVSRAWLSGSAARTCGWLFLDKRAGGGASD